MADKSPRRASGLRLLLNLTRRNRTVIFTVTKETGASTLPSPVYVAVDSLAVSTHAGLFLVSAHDVRILAQVVRVFYAGYAREIHSDLTKAATKCARPKTE
jgi:hypothetical protein